MNHAWEIFTHGLVSYTHTHIFVYKTTDYVLVVCMVSMVQVRTRHWWEPWELYKTWENINQNALFFTGEHKIRIHKFHIIFFLFLLDSSVKLFFCSWHWMLHTCIECVACSSLSLLTGIAICVWDVLCHGYLLFVGI